MKLLYVVHQFFPDFYSGTEQYVLAAAREARRRGDEVVILSLVPDFANQKPPLELWDQPHDGFTVLRLRAAAFLQPNEQLREYENPLIAATFRGVLAERQPDAVHFFHLRYLGSDLIPVARQAGIRSVVHLMDYWYLCPRVTLLRSDGTVCEGPPNGGLGCLDCHYPDLVGTFHDQDVREAGAAFARAHRQTPVLPHRAAGTAAVLRRLDTQLARLGQADVVIAPSRFLAALFERHGLAADRLRVVPYGLEPDRVRRIDVERPRQPLRVVFAGILTPWKGPQVLVDAVTRVEGALQLDVWGPVDEFGFPDHTAALRAAAGADPRITMHGAYDATGLSEVLAAADVVVVPSTWYENTPFVILEAFEAGVPVIASDLGGMAELIIEGQNGFLFEAGNAAALAAVLRRCLAEPRLLGALRPARPGTIADNYDAFLSAYRNGS